MVDARTHNEARELDEMYLEPRKRSIDQIANPS